MKGTASLAEQVAAGTRGELRDIAVELLRVAEWNARKTFDPAALAELTQSIREHEIQVPLLVRPFPKSSWHNPEDEDLVRGGSLFEVVAGHRRLMAAKSLGHLDVPCLVRDLNDAEAREIGLVDNLQREDVPALEEADAYNELKQTLGTAAAIAQRVGKEVAYVTKRLQLVQLGQHPRRALAQRLITIDHALLLARLGGEEQDANLKWMLSPGAGVKEKLEDVIAARLKDLHDTNYLWEPQSAARLKDHIEEHVGRKLSRAPWDLDATNLTEDGRACTGCPANTRDNTALFGDLAIDEATCENGRCFEAKRATYVHIQIAGAPPVEAHIPAMRLSWKDSTAKPRALDQSNVKYLAQTFRHGQWVEAKKGSCGFAHVGVTVDWSDDNHHGFGPNSSKLRKPGELLTVCVAAGCKVHPKAWEKAAKQAEEHPRGETSEQREQRVAKQKVLTDAENAIRARLVTEAISKLDKLPGDALRKLVLRSAGWRIQEAEEFFPGIEKTLRTAKPDSREFARAAAGVLFVEGDDDGDVWTNEYGAVEDGRKEFLATLKLLGVDGSSAWLKPKAEKKPAPKKQPAKKVANKAAKKAGRK